MQTNTLILIGVVIVVALVVVLFLMRRRASSQLRSRFGPEYDRVVEEIGGKEKAEAQLSERQRRVDKFTIKPLGGPERDSFTARWHTLQGQFVDNPSMALTSADTLLGEVMAARGYPVEDFEQRSADLSVDHPVVVQNYRAAHDIAAREGTGEVDTEDRRRAMLSYRTLFDELVDPPTTPETGPGKAEKVDDHG